MLFPLVTVLMTVGFIHFSSEVALAQTVPVEAQSGTIEKSMPQFPPTFAPPPEIEAPKITNGGSKQDRDSLKPSKASPKFFIKKIKLSGNTVISDEILMPIVDLGEGKDVDLTILNTMANKISALYSTKGYLLARAFVPKQEIVDGIVEIIITEGRINEVLVQGSNGLATDKNVKNTKPWANIDGFRSAKFGMSMKNVKNAIYKDFNLRDSKISTIKHPTEQTQSLGITVKQLLPNSGKSRIVYVFGYKTNKLIQVNILLGHPVDTSVTPQQIVDSGNILGNHFFKKRYQEDGLVAHARLNDGSILIFRGKDQKGSMALLRLSNPQPKDQDAKDLKVSLSLSYIEKPGKPDAYQLKDNDF